MENQSILTGPRSQLVKNEEHNIESGNNGNNNNNNNNKLTCCQLIPKRYILAIFAFFGFFFGYILRANLSVAIVEMSHVTTEPTFTLSNDTHGAVFQLTELKWSPVLQGYILSSFFYGYIIAQLPAGHLTNKYGGRLFFGVGIGLCAIFSLLIPAASRIGAGAVIVLRILQGLAQGLIFPSMHCLWSKWSPSVERSRLTTFALAGSYVGTVCALSLGGIIGRLINWESIFYIFGAASLIWSALWFAFIYESPAEHATILDEEKQYVQSSITHHASQTIPWCDIFKSPPVWAIICAHFAENWGFYTMLTEMPTYFAERLSYKVDKAGFASSLPYLTMAIILYASGYISDYLIEKKKIRCTIVRKVFCSSGLIIQSIFMLIIPTLKGPISLIICFIIAIGFGGMPWASFGVNHLDVGSGYANVLMSISNFFATIPGIVSPILTGNLIENKDDPKWNVVFYIAAVIFLFGSIMYAILGSGEIQEWAITKSNYDTINSDKNSNKNNNTENKLN